MSRLNLIQCDCCGAQHDVETADYRRFAWASFDVHSEPAASRQVDLCPTCCRRIEAAIATALLPGPPLTEPPRLETLETVEQRHVLSILNYLNGNKSQAAQILGIERSTLHRKLSLYSISPTSRPDLLPESNVPSHAI